jgi:hypothetical protein
MGRMEREREGETKRRPIPHIIMTRTPPCRPHARDFISKRITAFDEPSSVFHLLFTLGRVRECVCKEDTPGGAASAHE